MNTVERIKMLLKEKNIPVSKMEHDLGFANGYIGQLKKGNIRDDRLNAIAEYLGVSTTYLSKGTSMLATDIFRGHDEAIAELQEAVDDPNYHFLMDIYDKIKFDPEKVRIMKSFMKSLSGDDDPDAY